jgi:hypothetical protein
MNINLVEVRAVAAEHLDLSKANWCIAGQGHPQVSASHRCREHLVRCGLLEDRGRSVPAEQLGRRQLDVVEAIEVAQLGTSN